MSAAPSAEKPIPAVAILGGGAFGRALAQVARRRGAEVIVWSRRELSDLAPGIRQTRSLEEAARSARVLYLCAPAAYARPLLRQLGDFVDGAHVLVHAARGLSSPGGLTVSQIAREETPLRRVGVLAGPLVPGELAAAIPGAIVVASRFPEVTRAAQETLAQPALRVYASDDLVGVELSAALMTVIALAAGIAHGLGGGISTRAVVVTRGIAQAARVLEALGAKARTLAGLGGIGEVMVTSQGVESPDYDLGVALGKGTPPAVALAALGRSAEGPQVARCVAELAAERKVNASLYAAIADVAEGRRPALEALRELAGGAVPTEM